MHKLPSGPRTGTLTTAVPELTGGVEDLAGIKDAIRGAGEGFEPQEWGRLLGRYLWFTRLCFVGACLWAADSGFSAVPRVRSSSGCVALWVGGCAPLPHCSDVPLLPCKR